MGLGVGVTGSFTEASVRYDVLANQSTARTEVQAQKLKELISIRNMMKPTSSIQGSVDIENQRMVLYVSICSHHLLHGSLVEALDSDLGVALWLMLMPRHSSKLASSTALSGSTIGHGISFQSAVIQDFVIEGTVSTLNLER